MDILDYMFIYHYDYNKVAMIMPGNYKVHWQVYMYMYTKASFGKVCLLLYDTKLVWQLLLGTAMSGDSVMSGPLVTCSMRYRSLPDKLWHD